MMSKEREVAYIESVVTDQGNGDSFCSACQIELDIMEIAKYRLSNIKKLLVKESAVEPLRCPNQDCNKMLEAGGIYIQLGGSDF